MIPLKPSAWRELGHAYGSAENIPALLSRLAEYPDESDYQNEPWFSLWSALCHQDDVYSASYAAVPHIVRLAERHPDKATMSYFLLPTAIEIDRAAGRGPTLPQELEQDYLQSLKQLGQIAAEQLKGTADELRSRYLRGAIAISEGDVASASCIIDPEDE
jgi:hypothetical protein